MAGRPTTEFTQEHIDAAKQLLGRKVYPSLVAKDLQRTLKIGRDKAYELIELARRQVFDALTSGNAADPLTTQYLFLESVVANERANTRDRVAAAAVVMRLLGLHKIMDQLGGTDPDEVLAAILARRQARAGTPPQPPPARANLGDPHGD